MPPAPEDKHQINHHKAESQETDPFLSETERGLMKSSNENAFQCQMNIDFFAPLCIFRKSDIFDSTLAFAGLTL